MENTDANFNLKPAVESEILATPILIVDDIQDNLDLLDEMLNEEGHGCVVQARSGLEALQALESRADIGLILLDLMMPVMDGYETCRRMTSSPKTSHIPIIVITGGAVRRDAALLKSFAAGAMDFIPKPVNEVELFGRVRSALSLYHERMRLRARTRALAESQQRYELAVNGVNDGIWDMNLLTHQIFLSRTWKEMLGYRDDELSNQMSVWESLVHPDDRANMHAAIQDHWDNKTPFFSHEHRVLTKSGLFKWVYTRGRALRDEQGRPQRMAGSTTDISARKNLELQLRQAQQMESIGRLSTGIAHDFNNLLTVILGNASLGRLNLPAGSVAGDNLAKIERASLQAAEFCKQLLTYSGHGRLTTLNLNLNILVSQITDLLRASISKKVELRFELAPEPLVVEVDPAQVQQVVMNLVINAAEAIADRTGVITLKTALVQTGEDALADAVLSPRLPRGDYVLLEVSDTGCGMSQEVQEKIFEPFFTTKFTGRGLGLSTALGVICAHKGALKLTSAIGHGTTFRVYLPKSRVEQVVMPTRAGTGVHLRGSGTVLVVDDEPEVCEVTKGFLNKIGFDVLLAHDGVQGVEMFRAHRDTLVAVVMDLSMPNLNGPEACDQIRLLRADLPVLLSSGYNEDESMKRYGDNGLSGFLQKPFTCETLELKLREIIPHLVTEVLV